MSLAAKAGAGKRGKNLLLSYSILMLLVVALAAAVLGLVLTSIVRGHLIRMHASLYADSLTTAFSAALPRESKEELARAKDVLGRDGLLLHVKAMSIWSPSGALLIDDSPAFLGTEQRTLLNDALAGRLRFAYVNAKVRGGTDPPRGDLVFYLPVRDHWRLVVGAVGIIESDEGLADDLALAARAIALSVSLAGVAIYAALFMLYFSSYRRQAGYSMRLEKSKDSIIFAMSSLSSLRDQETGGHLERCREYVRVLALGLHASRQFRRYVDADYVEAVAAIAPLHDIGKVGIDDAILRKPDRLTPQEYEVMKTHSSLGASILETARERLPLESDLDLAIELTRHHHERWDGKGYPDGLAGEAIPLSARIMAIADVYDALRSERYYKKAYSHEEALRIIAEGSGSQFDPRLVAIATDCGAKLERIFGELP